MEISFEALVDILAASILAFSNSSFSFCEYLSKITSAFSKNGRIKAIQMVSRGFLSSFKCVFSIIFFSAPCFFF